MKAFTVLTALIGLVAASPVAAVAEEAQVDKRYGAPRIYPGETYYIRSVLDYDLTLDLSGGQPEGVVLAYNFHGGTNQQWRAQQFGNAFGFQNVASGTWLTAPDSNNGGQVRGSRTPPNRVTYPRWLVENQGDGAFIVRSASRSNLVLDISGGEAVSGSKIITYQAHGGENQLWRFEAV